MLACVRGDNKKETIRCTLAEFAIMELIVNRVVDIPTRDHQKAYAYYREKLGKDKE